MYGFRVFLPLKTCTDAEVTNLTLVRGRRCSREDIWASRDSMLRQDSVPSADIVHELLKPARELREVSLQA